MKLKFKNLLLIGSIVISVILGSCKKEKKQKDVNDEGLTEEIVNLVPDSILVEIKSMGMPINGGATPPNIEDSYIASPFVLKATTVNTFQIGHTFADFKVRFQNQDNNELSISMDYINGGETGTGMESYVVGENNKFSVFCEVNADHNGSSAKMVIIISGEVATGGIKDLYLSNFMLDNYGNPSGYWIGNGKGRVIYDSDGFSPTTNSFYRTINLYDKSASVNSF